MQGLNWDNLKANICPKCGAGLMARDFTYGTGYVCADAQCDFKIGADKFQELTNSHGQNQNTN